jgi:hypothetical protein
LNKSSNLNTVLKSGTIFVRFTITSEHYSIVKFSILISKSIFFYIFGLSNSYKLNSIEKAWPYARSVPANKIKHLRSI